MIKEWIDKQKVIRGLEKMFTLYYEQWSKVIESTVNEEHLEEKLKTADAINNGYIIYYLIYIMSQI